MCRLFTLVSAVAAGAAAIFAAEPADSVASVVDNGLRFTLMADGDVSVAADTAAAHIDLTGRVEIPEQVEIDGVMHTVTAIADRAFASNEQVTEVILPSTIKTIGVRAFSNCRISTIDLPDGLESIGEEAFGSGGRFGITSIVIPPSVSYIGVRAFFNAPLTEIRIEGDDDSPLLTIADGAFDGTRRTLDAIYVERAEPPVLGQDVFRQSELTHIYLTGDAAENEDAYRKADGWKDIPFNTTGDVTGLDAPGLATEADAPVEYYTLSGIKVKSPDRGGVYIVRHGRNVVKRVF